MRVAKPFADARRACTFCLLAGAVAGLPAVSTYAADFDQNLKLNRPLVVVQAATPKGPKGKPAPATSPVAPNTAGADIVGKLLANPPSDPNVPLPQRDLTARAPVEGPSDNPHIYGRQEEGGGVFGLKIPIPADRSSPDRHTRYSNGPGSTD